MKVYRLRIEYARFVLKSILMKDRIGLRLASIYFTMNAFISGLLLITKRDVLMIIIGLGNLYA